MSKEQEIEKIARELFDIWVEAKSDLPNGDNWNDQTWETLPEKHRDEYIKTAARIYGYRLPSLPPDKQVETIAEALFDHAIEQGRVAAVEDGLDKLGMMPYMSKWSEMGEEDKKWWRKEAKANIKIVTSLVYPAELKAPNIRDIAAAIISKGELSNG